MRRSFLLIIAICISMLTSEARSQATSFKFEFGPGKIHSGYVQVLPDMAYSKDRGFGFEPGADVKGVDRSESGLIASDKPFQFSVAVPEGSYQVTVTLGDPHGESKTTVKAELRRLFVEKAHLSSGKVQSYTFNVNVRTPRIPGGGEVRLKSRERQNEAKAWDDKLTLEFDDQKPCLRAVEIHPVDNLPVVYICGDSTVCDQPGENNASWGQMLTRFFRPDVVIANHAESGESLRDFIGEKRWAKVMSTMKPGDYMIVQMGHNDEKDRRPGAGAMTSYKTFLKQFVANTRAKGATPIIVSPMERLNFEGNRIKPSHGQFPEAVRQVAKEDHVAFIDLTELSVTFYQTLGPDKAYLAFAGIGTKRDRTHHDNYGAYELAKMIVQGIKQNKLDLAKSIVDDFHGFDPAKPDDVDSFAMPAGPSRVTDRPLGN